MTAIDNTTQIPLSESLIKKREHQLDDVWQLINQRAVNPALQACDNFTRQYQDYDHGWYAFSFLLLQLKRGKQALECINNALLISPSSTPWLTHKAHVLWLLNRICEGKDELQKIIIIPDDNAAIAELADVSNKLEDYALAEKCYQAMLAGASTVKSKAHLYFNLGSVQRYLGKLGDAEQSLNNALHLNPLDTEAALLRASLRKQSPEQNHIQQLQSLLESKDLNPLQRTQLCFGLAKELEDLQNYSQSFSYLQQGARCRRQSIRYDVKGDIQTLDDIRHTFTSEFFHQISDLDDNRNRQTAAVPVFILGLPRTGSTLLERILSNHSMVNSAGELNHFSLQLMQQIWLQFQQKPESKKATIELSSKLNLSSLGQAYLDATQSYWQQHRYFIDKLPLNSLNIGLIKGALPQAKIILVQRHPLDTCYAIYKHLFTQGYPFSYDLGELGEYYIAHHKLMQHWLAQLGDDILPVEYESLISDPEQQTRKILDYCALPFESTCLQFEKNSQASTTASASQVRQGIYRDSVAKWRHYNDQLQELSERLRQAGIPV